MSGKTIIAIKLKVKGNENFYSFWQFVIINKLEKNNLAALTHLLIMQDILWIIKVAGIGKF